MPDWDYAHLSVGAHILDIVPKRDPEPHWDTYFDGDVPKALVSGTISGWATVSERVRVAGAFLNQPNLGLIATQVGAMAQVLPGSAERSAFQIGASLGYIVNDQFHFLAPVAFIEWSLELFRTDGARRPPTIMYIGARLDQGARFVWGRAADTPDSETDFMAPLFRSLIQFRTGKYRAGYVFGGHRRLKLSHTFEFGVTLGRLDKNEPNSGRF